MVVLNYIRRGMGTEPVSTEIRCGKGRAIATTQGVKGDLRGADSSKYEYSNFTHQTMRRTPRESAKLATL